MTRAWHVEVRGDQEARSLRGGRWGRINGVVTVQTRLVLATLCVFNGVILTALGLGSALFVDGLGRLGLAAAMWVTAVFLFGLARRLRQDVEWH
jgi:hypothetical protein